ncbi:MAG: DUF4430 domain-containing protein [Bdellovibrionales bacterium]|nr:DUF4430 domain-containing protein [Bdellovibrionales bacterium]
MNWKAKSMKMPFIALFFTALFSTQTQAISYAVVGPCSPESLYAGSFKVDLKENLGAISLAIFENQNIPFSGTEYGMSSIVNTPVGIDAIEVLSDTKMRAYGWCFSVNGIIPDVLSNEVFFTNQNDYLLWFYAYSTYDQGVWTDYCEPSHQIKAQQFCKNP